MSDIGIVSIFILVVLILFMLSVEKRLDKIIKLLEDKK